jgi:hypothetical protein
LVKEGRDVASKDLAQAKGVNAALSKVVFDFVLPNRLPTFQLKGVKSHRATLSYAFLEP